MRNPLGDPLSDCPDERMEIDDGSEPHSLLVEGEVGGLLNVPVGSQIILDIVYGVLRDWTCISAGLRGPWTDSSEYPLRDVLTKCKPFRFRPSTEAVYDRSSWNFQASTASTDPFSMRDVNDATRRSDLSRPRRGVTGAREWSQHTGVYSPHTELMENVSSRKRRRIFRNGAASLVRDVPGTNGRFSLACPH